MWSQGHTYYRHIPSTGYENSATNCHLQKGYSSLAVRVLQEALVYCWNQNVGGIDGVFGTRTYNALRYVQGRLGIQQDGIYGPHTMDWMGWYDGTDPVGAWPSYENNQIYGGSYCGQDNRPILASSVTGFGVTGEGIRSGAR